MEGESDRDYFGREDCDKIPETVAPDWGDIEGVETGGNSRAPQACLRHWGCHLGKALF